MGSIYLISDSLSAPCKRPVQAMQSLWSAGKSGLRCTDTNFGFGSAVSWTVLGQCNYVAAWKNIDFLV